jgi:hypothetical protein
MNDKQGDGMEIETFNVVIVRSDTVIVRLKMEIESLGMKTKSYKTAILTYYMVRERPKMGIESSGM